MDMEYIFPFKYLDYLIPYLENIVQSFGTWMFLFEENYEYFQQIEEIVYQFWKKVIQLLKCNNLIYSKYESLKERK